MSARTKGDYPQFAERAGFTASSTDRTRTCDPGLIEAAADLPQLLDLGRRGEDQVEGRSLLLGGGVEDGKPLLDRLLRPPAAAVEQLADDRQLTGPGPFDQLLHRGRDVVRGDGFEQGRAEAGGAAGERVAGPAGVARAEPPAGVPLRPGRRLAVWPVW
jgi:hypothetical protein